MEVVTTEILCKRIGKENLTSVILWVNYLLEQQKETMVRAERDVADLEQAKAKYLNKTLVDLRGALEGDRKGSTNVPTNLSNSR